VAKYRQHGYQDSDREPRRQEPRKPPEERKSGPPKWDHAMGPRPLNLPGTRDVSRCAQCGTLLVDMPAGMAADQKCPKCGFELHSCKQCTYFDPGSRFECMQPVKERIAKKDERNLCELFEIRVTREKETSTPASLRPTSARAAFDNLFKK
jgi:phage FluMu protein Com